MGVLRGVGGWKFGHQEERRGGKEGMQEAQEAQQREGGKKGVKSKMTRKPGERCDPGVFSVGELG